MFNSFVSEGISPLLILEAIPWLLLLDTFYCTLLSSGKFFFFMPGSCIPHSPFLLPQINQPENGAKEGHTRGPYKAKKQNWASNPTLKVWDEV